MNNEKLGEAFISGRVLNLDKTSVEDLKRFKEENYAERKRLMENFDGLIKEIRSI